MRYLKTNDVIIRKFKKDDIYKLNDILENVNVSGMNNKIKTSRLIESAICEYYSEEPVWALEEKQTQKLFGYIKIENYSPKNKVCDISWFVKDEYADSCLIKQALRKVINFLFKKKNVDLIECSYYGQNEQKDMILGNIGMKKEAVLKQRRYNEETRKKEDFIIYSINVSDFYQLKLCNV